MNKVLGLGSVASAAAGITISAATNATPIVVTLGAGHGLKNNDRIAVTGITGNTGANGEWSLDAIGATAGTLRGSVGNGVFGGTAAVAVLCDTTPHMKGHSAAASVFNNPGAAVFSGTLLIEGSADNVTFADAQASGLIAIPATTTGMAYNTEVTLSKYMRLRCSAYTSGGAKASLIA